MLAMAAAVVIASVPSLLFNWPWALEPITEKVMLATPVDIAQLLILHLGAGAGPLALLGGFALYLLLGGALGAIAALSSTPVPGLVPPLAALLMLLLVLFVVVPPTATGPTVILAGTYVLILAFERAAAPLAKRGAMLERIGRVDSRRRFIAGSARIVGSSVLLTAMLLIEPWYKSMTVYRRGGKLFAFSPPRAVGHGFQVQGLTPELTPIADFYYLSKNLVDPDLTAEGWSLRIGGLVRRPHAYTFDELLSLPSASEYVTQECVSNPVGGPLMSCALFTGVPLRTLLAAAGPLPPAAKVVMRAPDGLADSISLDLALTPDVLVAYGMNGSYLERRHGYPARMLIPGSYGFKSIKWVTEITLVDHRFRGTWQEQGWTESAIVHSTARIDVVRRDTGGALIAGMAFAGSRGVGRCTGTCKRRCMGGRDAASSGALAADLGAVASAVAGEGTHDHRSAHVRR
jgi:DMSO/TMAO reductase YedYZ molybdopterin-dependent catalytic subunit